MDESLIHSCECYSPEDVTLTASRQPGDGCERCWLQHTCHGRPRTRRGQTAGLCAHLAPAHARGNATLPSCSGSAAGGLLGTCREGQQTPLLLCNRDSSVGKKNHFLTWEETAHSLLHPKAEVSAPWEHPLRAVNTHLDRGCKHWFGRRPPERCPAEHTVPGQCPRAADKWSSSLWLPSLRRCVLTPEHHSND